MPANSRALRMVPRRAKGQGRKGRDEDTMQGQTQETFMTSSPDSPVLHAPIQALVSISEQGRIFLELGFSAPPLNISPGCAPGNEQWCDNAEKSRLKEDDRFTGHTWVYFLSRLEEGSWMLFSSTR